MVLVGMGIERLREQGTRGKIMVLVGGGNRY